MDNQDDSAGKTLDGLPETPATLAARYDLLGELGRGGMGVVYKARDRETGAIVALKVLRPEIASRPELLERFKAELLLARKITHKNVCRVYDLNRFGEVAAISMEYVEGESLRAILARVGGTSLRWGLEWVGQMCAALAEAHAQGVAHRDLKPENILIDRQGSVKVMDFGIARSIESAATQTSGVLGTPAYMSPEQAQGKPADARSDIYSLGLILYEMFTGQSAFRADTPVALALKQIQETPPPPREINPYLPGFLDRAVRKCLEKNPARRFQSAEELESAMQPGAEVEPAARALPETEPLAVPTEAAQWQRLDTWLLGGGVLAAIIFFALFSGVYPFASLRIHVGQKEAVEKALAVVKKFEPGATSGRAEPYWRWWMSQPPNLSFVSLPEIDQAITVIYKHQAASRWWLVSYPAKVRVLGLAEANRQLVYDQNWEVQVDLGPSRGQAWAGLRNDGSSCELTLPPPPGSAVPSLPSREQATRQGVSYVRQVFGTEVSNLEPKLQNSPLETSVVWELPGPLPDLKRVMSVRFGPKGWIAVREDFRSQHESEIKAQFYGAYYIQDFLLIRRSGLATALPFLLTLLAMVVLFFARRLYQGAGLALVLAALCITICFGGILMTMSWRGFNFPQFLGLLTILTFLLIFARRLYQEPRRSVTLIALCVTLSFSGTWFQDHEETELLSLTVPAVAIVIFLFHFCVFATAEDYLWRRLRSRIVTWFLLVRRPGEARAAGLSILRGCALGFIFLAAHTLVVYALGAARLAGSNTFWLETAALSGRPYLPVYALSYAVLATVPRVWYLFGFPAALVAGISRRPLALVGVPAALCALMVFWLPGTAPTMAWLAYFFAAFQGVVFSLIFYRYDLLTLACAIFTIEIWLLVYPVWTIFSDIEPVQPSLSMAPWFLLLTAGALIYLRPQLQAARRQVAAVFE